MRVLALSECCITITAILSQVWLLVLFVPKRDRSS